MNVALMKPEKSDNRACLDLAKTYKRRLPSRLEDEDCESVAKKRKQCNNDCGACFPGREAPPAAGADSVHGGTPIAVSRRARKRPAASSPLCLSQCSAKKKRYARVDETCFDTATASLCGAEAAAEGASIDGLWNSPKKRSCPSASGSKTSSILYIKTVKRSAIPTPRESLPCSGEDTEGPGDKDLSIVRCRSESLLQELGVRLLHKRQVKAMMEEVYEPLGAGSYGSCCRSVDTCTQQQVVIKTFFGKNMDMLMSEVENLQRLQMAGVQRLMGVCVETCQLVTYFAGNTADVYFQKVISFSAATSVFLQVARTLQGLVREGFTHNDLKDDNVCVSEGSGGPVATVIDLGLVSPVGTDCLYVKSSRPETLPWLAPELLLHTHPTSEASDAYSLAFMMEEVLGLDAGGDYCPRVAALANWMKAARRPDPAQRPSLAALVQVLEALCEDASRTQSATDGFSEREEVCPQEDSSHEQILEFPSEKISSSVACSGHSPEVELLPQSARARLLQWCRRHAVPVTRGAVSRRGRRVYSLEKVYGRLNVVEMDHMKMLVYRHDWQKFSDLRFLKRHVKALSRCRGRGVEELVGVCVEEAAVVTQFPGMPLSELLASEVLSDERKTAILYRTFGIVERLLRTAQYAHNDIGPESVWVATRGGELQVTLTDFWLAGRVRRHVWTLLGDDPGLHRFLRARHPGLCADVRRGTTARGPGPATEVFSLAVLTHTVLFQGGFYPRRLRSWVRRATRESHRERPTLQKGLELLRAMWKNIDQS